MLEQIDRRLLADVTGGGRRGTSPAAMLCLMGIMLSKMGGPKERTMKMFDLFKGMLAKQLPGAKKDDGKKDEGKKDEKK